MMLLNPYRHGAAPPPAGAQAAVSILNTATGFFPAAVLDTYNGRAVHVVAHQGNRNADPDPAATQMPGNDLANNVGAGGSADCEMMIAYADDTATNQLSHPYSLSSGPASSGGSAAASLGITSGTLDTASLIEVIEWDGTVTLHNIPAVAGLGANDLVITALGLACDTTSTDPTPPTDVAGPYTQLGVTQISQGTRHIGLMMFTATATAGAVAAWGFTSASDTQITMCQFVIRGSV